MAKQPRVHKSLFGKMFGRAFDKVKGWFSTLKKQSDGKLINAAILITNAVKTFLENDIVLTAIYITPTTIDDELLKIANKWLPMLLADELLIKGINQATVEADVQKVLLQVLSTFGNITDVDKEELYTSIAAKLYILYEQVKHGNKVTFGQAAALVEEAYQAWRLSL